MMVKSVIPIEGLQSFFEALSHDSLQNYYQMNFGMMQHHNWSLAELEEMIPWEREIYIGLLMNYLKEEKQRQEQENRKMK